MLEIIFASLDVISVAFTSPISLAFLSFLVIYLFSLHHNTALFMVSVLRLDSENFTQAAAETPHKRGAKYLLQV